MKDSPKVRGLCWSLRLEFLGYKFGVWGLGPEDFGKNHSLGLGRRILDAQR